MEPNTIRCGSQVYQAAVKTVGNEPNEKKCTYLFGVKYGTLLSPFEKSFPLKKSTLLQSHDGRKPIKQIDIIENVLFLNIFIPSLGLIDESNHKPVVVFVPNTPYILAEENTINSRICDYGPEDLLQNDVVVVTVSYRCGILGLLEQIEKEININAIDDVKLAFEWIRENIASFNGDPNNVTAIGHGLGAYLVHTLCEMNTFENVLFHKVHLLSGSQNCLMYGPITLDVFFDSFGHRVPKEKYEKVLLRYNLLNNQRFTQLIRKNFQLCRYKNSSKKTTVLEKYPVPMIIGYDEFHIAANFFLYNYKKNWFSTFLSKLIASHCQNSKQLRLVLAHFFNLEYEDFFTDVNNNISLELDYSKDINDFTGNQEKEMIFVRQKCIAFVNEYLHDTEAQIGFIKIISYLLIGKGIYDTILQRTQDEGAPTFYYVCGNFETVKIDPIRQGCEVRFLFQIPFSSGFLNETLVKEQAKYFLKLWMRFVKNDKLQSYWKPTEILNIPCLYMRQHKFAHIYIPVIYFLLPPWSIFKTALSQKENNFLSQTG